MFYLTLNPVAARAGGTYWPSRRLWHWAMTLFKSVSFVCFISMKESIHVCCWFCYRRRGEGFRDPSFNIILAQFFCPPYPSTSFQDLNERRHRALLHSIWCFWKFNRKTKNRQLSLLALSRSELRQSLQIVFTVSPFSILHYTDWLPQRRRTVNTFAPLKIRGVETISGSSWRHSRNLAVEADNNHESPCSQY